MRSSLIEDMLLIQEPSVMVLYREMNDIALNFLPAMFLLGILFAFLTDMNFVGDILVLLCLAAGANTDAAAAAASAASDAPEPAAAAA